MYEIDNIRQYFAHTAGPEAGAGQNEDYEVTATSDKVTVAAPPATAITGTDDLTITLNGVGSATITVTATETANDLNTPVQSAQLKFLLVVNVE